MSDIKLRWDSDLMKGDLLFPSNDLETENGLATSVIISLFSDKRASGEDTLPDPNSTDKRGFWGDLVLPAVEGDQLGSKLWLLERSKTIQEVMESAEQYIEESLKWMIDDGIVLGIDIDVERQNIEGAMDMLAFKVSLHKVDGLNENYEFDYEWGNT